MPNLKHATISNPPPKIIIRYLAQTCLKQHNQLEILSTYSE